MFGIWKGASDIIIDPKQIEDFLYTESKPENVRVVPWQTKAFDLDFTAIVEDKTVGIANFRRTNKNTIEDMERHAEEVRENDPLIKEWFKIDGPGEGACCSYTEC